MQTSELDQNKNKFTGDEECINFRPSPNFKHMKKYLKSKFEETNSSPNQSSDQSSTPNSEEQESVKPESVIPEIVKTECVQPEGPESRVDQDSRMAQRVQPPLPPHSPPPDLIVPKQEVIDEEYETPAQPQAEKAEDVKPQSADRVMCRQFARGRCMRGASCIFVHEIIHSQLPDVYTFCKNFQNSICSFPKCKFVHATVFEKEHYYRTGLLPPHTLAHLKETNSALALPTALEVTPAVGAQVFPTAPPHPCATMSTSGYAPPPVIESVNGQSQAKHKFPGYGTADQGTAVPPEEGNAPKKCKTCDASIIRVHNSETKLDLLRDELKTLQMQSQMLAKKESRINGVFENLVKSKDFHQNSGPSLPIPAPSFTDARSIENRILVNEFLDLLKRARGSDDTGSKGAPHTRF